MNYLRLEDQKILNLDDVRSIFKHLSFPDSGPDDQWLSENNLAKFHVYEAPQEEPGYKYFSDGIEFKNHQWQVKWSKREKTEEEKVQYLEELNNALASYRYNKEVGGIVISGVNIQTDRETRANLIGARIRATENELFSLTWKTDPGFVNLQSAQIVMIADAVASHVQKCFLAESLVFNKLDYLMSVPEVYSLFDQEYENQ